MPPPFAAQYRAAQRLAGGRDPIDAGLIGRLADHECRHGRLAFDHTPPCGCWPEEAASAHPSASTPPGAPAPPGRRPAAV